jgi:hypothetical protein
MKKLLFILLLIPMAFQAKAVHTWYWDNSGQTIEQLAAPTPALGGNCFIYQYNAALAIWYKEQ